MHEAAAAAAAQTPNWNWLKSQGQNYLPLKIETTVCHYTNARTHIRTGDHRCHRFSKREVCLHKRYHISISPAIMRAGPTTYVRRCVFDVHKWLNLKDSVGMTHTSIQLM